MWGTNGHKSPSHIEQARDGWRATVLVDGQRREVGVRHGQGAEQAAHEDALRLLKQAEVARDSEPARKLDATLQDAKDAILRHCERRDRRPATAKWYEWHLAPVFEHFGADRKLASISVQQVQRFIDARAEGGAGGRAIRHDMQALGRCFKMAGMDSTPVKSERPIVPKVKKRSLMLRMAWSDVAGAIKKLKAKDEEAAAVLAFIAGFEGPQVEEDGREDQSDLRRRIESYVRRRVPAREVEEVADEAIVRAYCWWMVRAQSSSLLAVALRAAATCCADWHRRKGRRGEAVPLPEDVADPDRRMSWTALMRPEVEALLARVDGALTARQQEMVRLVFSGEGRTMSELGRRMSLSSTALEAMLRAVADKIRSGGCR